MVQRHLRKERRAGVLHYVPGQEEFVDRSDDDLILVEQTFVDQMGHAVQRIWGKLEGNWLIVHQRRAGQINYIFNAVQEGLVPSEELVKKLDDAIR